MDPIVDVAERLGLDEAHLIPYGHYKAKVSLDALANSQTQGKLVVVTGITPTPGCALDDVEIAVPIHVPHDVESVPGPGRSRIPERPARWQCIPTGGESATAGVE